MTVKYRQFQKNHTCLTSCQTTSGAPIGDLIVAFCTHFILRKSRERAAPNAEQNFFTDSKTELGAFLPPSAIRGLNVLFALTTGLIVMLLLLTRQHCLVLTQGRLAIANLLCYNAI